MGELVSIITPAYNCSRVVAETITSVLEQTYTNWELIIVDDASTDDTLKVINDFASRDQRIKIFSMGKNGGSAAAKNFAISHAQGRFIAFLDADDIWDKEKLQIQLAFMEENNYCFTFTSYEFMKEGEKYRYYFNVPSKVTYNNYLGNTIIGNSTVMMDRDQIRDIHVETGYLEDVLTWMHYLRKGYIAYGINKNLMSYRVYPNSKSGKKTKNAMRYFKCLRETQHLSFFVALYYQMSYMTNALKKRVFTKKRKV